MNLQEFNHGRSDASADPYAGTTAANGKEIWTAEEAGENLTRTGQNWYVDNYNELDDGVLNFGFWDLDSLLTSYYVSRDGETAFSEAYYYEAFVPFSAEQVALARNSIGLWDEVMGISIVESDIANADITFGNTDAGPFSGAYAYLPFGDGLDAIYDYYYNFESVGRLGGDVWINTQEDANYTNMAPGSYANFAITHELGHALGLSHAGEYNATNPDGSANPADYAGDAYFFQDSHQYTIMSYFGGEETGAQWINWSTMTYGYAATPMVHDIVSVQQVYGADTTTRIGNTTYGFNSNAGRTAYDMTQSLTPIFTIWDAGGTDTLDLSGYDTPSLIDLNEGAFSSAGGFANVNLTLEQVNANRVAAGLAPRDQAGYDSYQDIKEQYGITNGLFKDNIGIAYGAKIENAVGGGGNDTIVGNALNNKLTGGNGDDTISGGNGVDTLIGGNGVDTLNGGDGNDSLDGGNAVDVLNGGAGNDTLTGGNGDDVLNGGAGNDLLKGGNGADKFVFADAGTDKIEGRQGGEKIDLSAFSGVDSSDVTLSAGMIKVELGANDLFINYTGTAVNMGDFIFA
jgi:Ca2+-binding RTX toxin-like protein